MEELIAQYGSCTLRLSVPAIALWAVVCLYTQETESPYRVTEWFFFGALLLVATFTVRTVLACDGCWLLHTATLGVMVVSGVVYRPSSCFDAEPAWPTADHGSGVESS